MSFIKNFFYSILRSRFFRLLYKIFCILPISNNKVLFASDSRSEMDGNFKYIYEEMRRNGLKLNYKFMLKKSIDTKKTYKEIILLAYYLATSKYILVDDFYPMVYPLKIRKGADLIQVWHAVGAFKKFGYSRAGLPGGPSLNSLNHKNYTKVIVSSKNVAKIYAEGFGIKEDKVYPLGIPRTDIFFSFDYYKQKTKELYDLFPFLKTKKVILFAPTFRGNGQNSAFYPLEKINFALLYEQLKEDYVLLIKLHPFIKNTDFIPEQYRDFIYDFSTYKEVNDLLFVTDILITDYSSICFEFALLNKPMIFFAFDLEEYIRQRDFYYQYDLFVPGSIAKTTKELVDKIKNRQFSMEKIQPFVNYFYDQKNGNSSKRFVQELIIKEPIYREHIVDIDRNAYRKSKV
ncbi:CDP-glycerol glycerophosphotransferase family protein [Bacillus salipaludis]|uniref:CDP-glycerol glycerophosphotransferase family protein n=1 Tax=Bacillus salipaludis TaxID=2547811 RepID=UPI002E1B3150|nr:CDP-glycerol glycerophosphotransferase family protein [Bacillus salipaludis]